MIYAECALQGLSHTFAIQLALDNIYWHVAHYAYGEPNDVPSPSNTASSHRRKLSCPSNSLPTALAVRVNFTKERLGIVRWNLLQLPK